MDIFTLSYADTESLQRACKHVSLGFKLEMWFALYTRTHTLRHALFYFKENQNPNADSATIVVFRLFT